MNPVSTNAQSSYESLEKALRAFALGKGSYEFSELQNLLKKHGWTLEQYLQEYEQQQTINRLKGTQ